MQDSDKFILSTRLEDCMLDVRERNLHFESLGREVAETVLVKFQVADCLSSLKVWLDDDVLQGITATLKNFELVRLHGNLVVLLLVLFFLLLVLDLLD